MTKTHHQNCDVAVALVQGFQIWSVEGVPAPVHLQDGLVDPNEMEPQFVTAIFGPTVPNGRKED